MENRAKTSVRNRSLKAPETDALDHRWRADLVVCLSRALLFREKRKQISSSCLDPYLHVGIVGKRRRMI